MRLHRLASPDLGRIFRGETVSGLSEWQLLERYLDGRDEAAFEALVRRHGPMVLGVCRRMLGDSADVDDAFQATFLVLVRRARHLGPCDAIGPWLYGVATRVALRARSQAARHRRFVPVALELPAVAPTDSHGDADLAEVLDLELSRLPAKYRAPLVLCYLEGRTHEEAARDLEWPVGTVKGRLSRARELLRSRLIRRGLAPTAGALGACSTPPATAALERTLIERTVSSSFYLASGQSIHHVVSASILSLFEGVSAAMILSKLKWAALAAILTGVVFTSAGVMARQGSKAQAPRTRQSVEKKLGKADATVRGVQDPGETQSTRLEEKESEREKVSEDPRRQLVQTSRSAYQATWEAYRSGHASAEQLYDASRRWMEAQSEPPIDSSARVAAASAHLERTRDLQRVESDRPHSPSKAAEVARIRSYVSQARLWLAQAGETPAENGSQGGFGPGQDPKSRLIIAKLEEPLSMSFANETPLDDVIKYIKQATTTSTFAGVQIYLDPVGLQEAERSLNSTVTMDLEGVPLRRTLQLVLAQLGLRYFVEDGMVYITSQDSADQLALTRKPSQILSRVARAERGELTLEEMKQLIEELKIREEVMKLGSGKSMDGRPQEGGEEAKRDREQMNAMLKEVRELIELMKAERQARDAPVMRKSAWRRGDRAVRR